MGGGGGGMAGGGRGRAKANGEKKVITKIMTLRIK
jgi:hypothetical protein